MTPSAQFREGVRTKLLTGQAWVGDGQGCRQTCFQMAEAQPGNSTPGIGPRDRNLITESVSCAEIAHFSIIQWKAGNTWTY